MEKRKRKSFVYRVHHNEKTRYRPVVRRYQMLRRTSVETVTTNLTILSLSTKLNTVTVVGLCGIGKHCTRVSQILELISSAYPVAVPGFEPRTSDMRGERVTTTPPTHASEFSRLNRRTCPRLSDVTGAPDSSNDDPMSPTKSETRVQGFSLVWTHRNNYARTGERPFKREWFEYELNVVSTRKYAEFVDKCICAQVTWVEPVIDNSCRISFLETKMILQCLAESTSSECSNHVGSCTLRVAGGVSRFRSQKNYYLGLLMLEVQGDQTDQSFQFYVPTDSSTEDSRERNGKGQAATERTIALLLVLCVSSGLHGFPHSLEPPADEATEGYRRLEPPVRYRLWEGSNKRWFPIKEYRGGLLDV
ncbi:hypothetical protein CSKR_111264 [Clonorchis sinensis]|uniref:Uncharacterized protein n=1 Tax=Clonorchis sinensis TaxID=79923 RepID=A0A3R7D3R1_CLOSI|nr:hypothetical protein CSKR_111264 [Clonorchis sinensis]